MKESEFIQQHPKNGNIQQTCYYLEKGAHKLMLMSRRQHMTVTELHAQVEVLQKWLYGYMGDIQKSRGAPFSPFFAPYLAHHNAA